MAPLLLLIAAASAAPHGGTRLQATVSARILPGERISLASAGEEAALESGRRARQHSRIRRTDGDGRRAELRLVEFQ